MESVDAIIIVVVVIVMKILCLLCRDVVDREIVLRASVQCGSVRLSEDTVRRIRDITTQTDNRNDVNQDNDLDNDGDELMAGTDKDNTLEALLTMPHNALQDVTRR